MTKRKNVFWTILLVFLSVGFLTSCEDDDTTTTTTGTTDNDTTVVETYDDWTTETHTKDVDPNFDVVFDNSSVMRLDIVIDADTWSDMNDNLDLIMSSVASDGPGGGGGPRGVGPGGDGPGETTDSLGYVQNLSLEDCDWYDCSLFFNDIEWYHVGLRFKGNSSLLNAYQSGSKKLSFKFDFDEFEDDYPDLKNQRFYGFKQLNLNNNYMDNSCMREKVTADLFRSFGVPAPHTRFVALYVNTGNGAEFYGIYALVEEVDDTVIDTQFDDNDGNLYKPDGNAASFGAGTYDEDQFVKKTNEDDADFTDVRALYDYLNADTRTTDPTLWQANLESVLDVSEYLKWMAANTIIQNWDTYGNMTHNYYLYNDVTTGLLNWIPWDNNEALKSTDKCVSLSLSEVTALWPLMNYVMTQDNYVAEYKADLQSFIDNVYNTSTMDALYSDYTALLTDYAAEENNTNFSSAVSELKQHVSDRATAVSDYLSE